MTARGRRSGTQAAPPRPRYAAMALLIFSAVVVVIGVQYFERARRTTEMNDTLYRTVELRQSIRRAVQARDVLLSTLAKLQTPEHVLGELKRRGIHLTVAPLERVLYLKLPRTLEGLPTDALPTPAAPTPKNKTLLISSHRVESP